MSSELIESMTTESMRQVLIDEAKGELNDARREFDKCVYQWYRQEMLRYAGISTSRGDSPEVGRAALWDRIHNAVTDMQYWGARIERIQKCDLSAFPFQITSFEEAIEWYNKLFEAAKEGNALPQVQV
jgi:hypothetical protein